MAKQRCPRCGGLRVIAANVDNQWMGGQCPQCKGTGQIETSYLGNLFSKETKIKPPFNFYDDFQIQQTIQNMKRTITMFDSSLNANSNSSLSLKCQELKHLAHYYYDFWEKWLEYNNVSDVKDFKRKKGTLRSQKEWQIGEESLKCFSEALKLANQISDSHEIAHCELWVGTLTAYIEKPNSARNHLNKALKLFEERRDYEKVKNTKLEIEYSYDL